MSSLSLPIETDRLILRPFERADLDALSAYHALPSVQRYVYSRTRDTSEVANALNILRNQVSLQRPGDTLSLAMVRKGDHRLIGHVSLHWSDATAGQGEVRFCINPAYAGQGFSREAISAMYDLAFDHFRIHRMFARCDGRNHHSIKLLQQMGMRLEAHYREHALFQGEWDEELHFAILDREWQRSSKVKDLPVRHRVA
ncbi:MAG: GNAT family protein [Candidatus Devosia phytovorans]|uniref:GNAT family protein n=1 Tax=Candidatus Devosia phytovorans TaxID=3121372 RepID=A0AAJ5VVI2_9HYPH|nr:GNAT family protein [Devosia sp.]WEK05579.1 MAG: GNAT family protein [Devosia sp.]